MDVQVSRLVRQLRAGSQTGQVLCDRLEMSRPTLSRLMEACRRAHPGFLCQIGAARSTRYAWAKAMDPVTGVGPVTGVDPVTGLEEAVNKPWNIPVHHVNRQGALQVMGTLTVLEAGEYLFEYGNDDALTKRFPNGWIRAHYEGIPWFLQDIRPQGYLGRALAQRLFERTDNVTVAARGLSEHVHQWNDNQVLRVISHVGDDLPGSFLVGDLSAERFLHPNRYPQGRDGDRPQQMEIRSEDRPAAYAHRVQELMSGQWIPHSSAGGEQPKFTACVTNAADAAVRQVIVKFSPSTQDGSIAAQRWRDLLLAEFHALSVLSRHGIPAAMTDTLQGIDGRWFLESTRFDRVGQQGRAPAFSLRSVILETAGDLPGWLRSAEILYSNAHIDVDTMEQIFLLDAYGHFIGNSDRHPGNLSFTLVEPLQALLTATGAERADSTRFTLAPAYDMLPMQYAPDAQGSMVPGFRAIAPYTAEHDMISVAQDLALLFWAEVVNDLRISRDFREIAIKHAESRLLVSQQADSDPRLEHAFHIGLLQTPPSDRDITGTVRALVKDANMNAFALVTTQEADGKTFAVPVSDMDRDRLSIGSTATFQVAEGSLCCAVVPAATAEVGEASKPSPSGAKARVPGF